MAIGASMAGSTSEKSKPWKRTPLIESTLLSKAAGCRIFLKLENIQPSGSFKIRGMGNLIVNAYARASNPSKAHIFSSSGGNAGLAAVFAANFVRCPSTVVVPMSTKQYMIDKIKAAGASEVIQYGPSWKEADTYMREVVMQKAAEQGEEPINAPPFDHEDIWEGHSWLVDELASQFKQIGEDAPDVVVCSVGGGGLFSGIVQGVKRQGGAWDERTQVLALETVGADALAQSLIKDELITLPGITSIATTLGATRVAERAYELAREGRRVEKIRSAVLSDAEAVMGCWRLADDERLLVEPSCGVSVAVCYGDRLKKALGRSVRSDEKIVIVVCGGSGVSTSMLESWRQEYGHLIEPALL